MNDDLERLELPEPVAWMCGPQCSTRHPLVRDAFMEIGAEITPLYTKSQVLAILADRQRQAQAAGVRAWETDDGRVISTAQKEQALRDGGASASSVAPYSIPLVAATAQAAEPVATMHVGMFGSTGFTGLDAGAKLPEGDYPLYTALHRSPRAAGGDDHRRNDHETHGSVRERAG